MWINIENEWINLSVAPFIIMTDNGCQIFYGTRFVKIYLIEGDDQSKSIIDKIKGYLDENRL